MPLFGKSKEAKEIEREVKFKQGLSRVRGFVDRSRASQRNLWGLGKRSLQLGDRKQFENIARAYLRMGETINRWERYMVSAETMAVQRGQVKATGDFLRSINALSESMLAGAKPEEIMKMQVELEKGLARAQTLDETLAVVMDASNESIFSSEGLSEESLKEVESAMSSEAARDEGAATDTRIDSGMKRIEELMKKELGGP